MALKKISQGNRKPAAAPAASRVCAMPELLEHILSYIVESDQYGANFQPKKQNLQAQHLRTLVCAQRVNTTFRDVIAKSKTIRRSMFVKHTLREEDNDGTLLKFNPLLFDLPSIMTVHKNSFSTWRKTSFYIHDYLDCFFNMNNDGYEELSHSTLKPGSWRETLVCNMSLSIRVEVTIKPIDEGQDWLHFDLKFQSGATLGELVDLLVDEIRKGCETLDC